MESLEHITGGGCWGTAWSFPAISLEVSPAEATWGDGGGSWWAPTGRKGLIWVYREGGLRGQWLVSGSSQQLVRAHPGPPWISHASAQLETRERQDSEAERQTDSLKERGWHAVSERQRGGERQAHRACDTAGRPSPAPRACSSSL